MARILNGHMHTNVNFTKLTCMDASENYAMLSPVEDA
jgi:hypothetical protein